MAICAVLAVQSAYAEETRRQVAVIDLSEDAAAKELSDRIYKAINLSTALRPPDRHEFDQYLFDEFLDEDGPSIDDAQTQYAYADRDLFQAYNSRDAASNAERGEQYLQNVVPTDKSRGLYAQLALLDGIAKLDQRDPDGAARAFGLAHRLDPSAMLDPARFSPDITSAFRHAIDAVPVPGKLGVQGSGRVWIDGQARGNAPLDALDVEQGDHYIVLTGDDRQTRGIAVRVDQKPTQAEIEDAPLSPGLQVARARLALSKAVAKADDAARAGAMRELADLLGVGDAVLISKRLDGKLQFETWRDRAPGFSPPQLYVSQKPEVLLEGLAPASRQPNAPVEDPRGSVGGITKPLVPEPEQPWYERRWVQASCAVGVAAVIVGVILIARRVEDVSINHDIMSGM
ncbi:MAG TPA: hypothetical protein VGG28_22305 [Kofleriaceae bacterium]